MQLTSLFVATVALFVSHSQAFGRDEGNSICLGTCARPEELSCPENSIPQYRKKLGCYMCCITDESTQPDDGDLLDDF